MSRPSSPFLACLLTMLRLFSLLLAVLMLFCCIFSGGASAQQLPQHQQPEQGKDFATDGTVWGALIYATNGPGKPLPNTVPTALLDLGPRLAKVFPYQSFEILGQRSQDVLRQYDSWVVPSKDIFLKLDSKGPAPDGGLSLAMQLWRDQVVLVKSDLILRRNSPLFISGPKWREGQLLFVLLLTKEEPR